MDALPERRFSLGRAERLAHPLGAFTGPTSGLAPGNVQANLVILPRRWRTISCASPRRTRSPARCWRSPSPAIRPSRRSARDLDIRTDLPRYRVWRHGELVEEPTDINHVWRDDLVSFAIGCSFSFEEALIEDGIEVRHIACGSQRADVPHLYPVRAGGRVPRAAGGVDAAAAAGGCDPRGADHLALSLGAWRAGASRHAGA